MSMWKEVRLAARTLAKRPGFTTITVVTLALGIGANIAIFSIVNSVLLRPLPYDDSEQIVEFRHHAPGLGFPEMQNSEGMIALYQEYADFYETIAPYSGGSANLTGGDEAARVRLGLLSPEVLQVLRTEPMLGRPFNSDDAGPDFSNAAILAYDTWRSRFGADPGIVGRTIELDGEPVDVVGVMPAGFAFPDPDVDVLRALYVDPEGPFGEFGMGAIARLSPDATVAGAQARSTELLNRVPEFFPDMQAEFLEAAQFAVTVETLRDRLVSDVETAMWLVMGTVAFVLLIACANVANLFLVRAESRQKEMAVRAAMGAGRRSVAGSFLSESLLLGVGGGIVGVIIAAGLVDGLLAITDLPRAAEVSVDLASLALAGLLSVTAGLVFGAIPMTRYAGSRFAAVLRDGGRGSTTGRARHRARNVLVAGQLALGLVLLVGSGLMLRSFAELRAVDLGIEPEGVLTIGLNRNRGEDPQIAARFFQDAADRIAALPGVSMVGITTSMPLMGGSNNGGSFYIESKPRQDDQLPPTALYRAVGPDYFRSMGIGLLSGRDVERADWEEARAVVWVNRQFEVDFLDGDAIGQRIAWGADEDNLDDAPWAEIVGVVDDVREFGLADEDLRPNAYFALVGNGAANLEIQSAFLTIKMEEGQSPTSVVASAEATLRELGPSVPITTTQTMDEVVSEAMESTSVTMLILGIATLMALFLGAIGMAGVISYVVGQRTREIGVRVALGAQVRDVTGLILKQSMVVTVGGAVLGLLGAAALTRMMETLLFEVSATDPLTFVTAPILLIGVSLLATWFPVRRATRVDPTVALRSE